LRQVLKPAARSRTFQQSATVLGIDELRNSHCAGYGRAARPTRLSAAADATDSPERRTAHACDQPVTTGHLPPRRSAKLRTVTWAFDGI